MTKHLWRYMTKHFMTFFKILVKFLFKGEHKTCRWIRKSGLLMDLKSSYRISFSRWSYFWILSNIGPVGKIKKIIFFCFWLNKQLLLFKLFYWFRKKTAFLFKTWKLWEKIVFTFYNSLCFIYSALPWCSSKQMIKYIFLLWDLLGQVHGEVDVGFWSQGHILWYWACPTLSAVV